MNYTLYPWLENFKNPSNIQFLQHAKEELYDKGVTTIPNFVTKEALENMRKESVKKGKVAYETNDLHNVYLLSPDMDLNTYPDKNHLRNRLYKTHVASIAYDELNPENTLAKLYNSETLLKLVAFVTGQKKCYHSIDPLGRCSVNVFKNTWQHAWHFDESEYSTTLMIQKPKDGGIFQYSEKIRDNSDELVVDLVENIMDDHLQPEERLVQRHDLTFEEGTLSIFSGRRSLHRVTDCYGDLDRLVAVFTFSQEKNYKNSIEVRKLFWGRSGEEDVSSSVSSKL